MPFAFYESGCFAQRIGGARLGGVSGEFLTDETYDLDDNGCKRKRSRSEEFDLASAETDSTA